MKKIAIIAAIAILATTAASARDLTTEEMALLAAESDKHVVCRDGCLMMNRAQVSQMMQLMAISLAEMTDQTCKAPGFAGGAPGSHSGLNKLP